MVLMLAAGAATCIITFVKGYSIIDKLVALFASLLIFYFLGSALKWTLDYFESQNEKKLAEEEMLEKELESEEGEEDSGVE